MSKRATGELIANGCIINELSNEMMSERIELEIADVYSICM